MENKRKDDKTLASISYITLLGTIIATILNNDKKNPFASFHIRQALGIFLLFMALGYPIGYFDNWMISSALWVSIFVLWIYGFIGALQGEMRSVPLVGDLFQKIFKNL